MTAAPSTANAPGWEQSSDGSWSRLVTDPDTGRVSRSRDRYTKPRPASTFQAACTHSMMTPGERCSWCALPEVPEQEPR